MMTVEINLREQKFLLRQLRPDDGARLGAFFDGLSAETRRRYAPHPLNREFARSLCDELIEDAITQRWAVLTEDQEAVLGYFILDRQMSTHEASRYQMQGITLEAGKDWLFAPVIADEWQNKGLASAVMPALLDQARLSGARSLVLLGGTQETNQKGIAFYQKFGFVQHGGYQTELYNLDMRAML